MTPRATPADEALLAELRRRVAELEARQRASGGGDRDALEEIERRYRSVIDTAGSVILGLDPRGNIFEWNRAAEQLYGHSREDVLGKNYLELFLPASVRAAVAADMQKVLAGRPTIGFENPVQTRNGDTRILLWNVTRLIDAKGNPKGIVAIGQDITQRHRVEAESRRLQEQLQQAQKQESLDILAGGIAQEFNKLLGQILTSAARARMIRETSQATRELVRDIERAARNAIDVANQMLTYAGQRSFERYAVFLNRHLEETNALLEPLIDERTTLRFRLAPELPPIMAHSGHLQQMIINLVTNASEALDTPGGTVTVSTGVAQADRHYLSSCYLGEPLREGEYVYLEVADDGVGIDPEVQTRMFDPFFSTNIPRRGLGLAAVLGIVRGHDGAIHVASTPGEGTTIRVLFPKPDPVPFEAGEV